MSQDYQTGFEDPVVLDDFTVSGAVSIDTTRAHTGNASLKVGPGGVATIIRSLTGQAARVEMWVYDDMTMPADTSAGRLGPRWGMVEADGGFLGGAIMYAAYLSGETHYAAPDDSTGNWFAVVQHLSQATRGSGWQKWVFDMDPETGMKYYFNDTGVTAFDWTKTSFKNVVGVKFFGDGVSDAFSQTIWIDDITVELKGNMGTDPTDDPVIPDTDPDYNGPPISLLPEVQGQHPRLMFSAEDLPNMRAFYNSAEGAKFASALDSYATATQSVTPTSAFVTNATEGQRYGMWQLPSVAMHYLLTGNQASLNKAKEMLQFLLAQPHWEAGEEQDCGMSAGNIMWGAALAYDWLYNDLDPTFREEFGAKLWYHARAMYHGGNLAKRPGTHYWQSDPQNNHRFHRDVGTMSAVIATFEGQENQMWLTSEMLKEVDFIVRWLPEDASNHEGPGYFVFGIAHLSTLLAVTDHAFGTNYLSCPYMQSAGIYRAQTLSPGQNATLGYGDENGNSLGNYNSALFQIVWHNKQASAYALIDKAYDMKPGAFFVSWLIFAGYRDERPMGTFENMPTSVLFPDMGVAYMRDSWTSGVYALFKCGPMGGLKLNEFRDVNDYKYINIAHDDPDANMFAFMADGRNWAINDGYSHHKVTSNHNTILVDGKGQRNPGRPEGDMWSQPSKDNSSMTELAFITNYKDDNVVTLTEGEAGNHYIDATLTRYRRTFIWNENKYILVFDDIRATESENITWLLQGPGVRTLDAVEGKHEFYLGARYKMPFQVRSTVTSTAVIGVSTADNQGTSLNLPQLQISASGSALQFASVYDVWGTHVAVEVVKQDADHATITVTGDDYVDTWTWTAATGERVASTFTLDSSDGQTFSSEKDPWQSLDHGYLLSYTNGDWYYTQWLGELYPHYWPWIYSTKHGWNYIVQPDEGGQMWWSRDFGWLWTSATFYPWFYHYGSSRWVCYVGGEIDEQWFYVSVGESGFYTQDPGSSAP